MKYVYLILGIVGVFSGIGGFICGIATPEISGGESFAIALISTIGILGSCIYFTVFGLAINSENMKKRIDEMEEYLMSKHEYMEFIQRIEFRNDPNTNKDSGVKEKELLPLSNNEELLNYAKKLLKEKSYYKAFVILCKLSDEGYSEAYQYLGYCYTAGHGTKKSENIAFEYYEKSLNAGIPDGKFLVGLAYLEGAGVKKDKSKGKELILKAEEEGSSAAKKYIATHRL